MGLILNTIYGSWKWLLAAKLKIKSSVVRNSSGEYLCHKGGEKAADSSSFGESGVSASTGGTKHDCELKNENLRLLVAAGIGWWVLALDLLELILYLLLLFCSLRWWNDLGFLLGQKRWSSWLFNVTGESSWNTLGNLLSPLCSAPSSSDIPGFWQGLGAEALRMSLFVCFVHPKAMSVTGGSSEN